MFVLQLNELYRNASGRSVSFVTPHEVFLSLNHDGDDDASSAKWSSSSKTSLDFFSPQRGRVFTGKMKRSEFILPLL